MISVKNTLLVFLGMTVGFESCSQPTKKQERFVGGPCEACDMMFEGMPQDLRWQTTIAEKDEPGEPLIIRGTIFKSDGKTPAEGVILYVYHTDNQGKYSPAPGQKHAKRHGHLRGWVKTNADGKYEFKTIRPASYPNSNNPQHIHPLIKEPGMSRYWIDEFLFDDDPLLSKNEKENQGKRGGSGLIHLTRNSDGVWIGERDIILGLNVAGY